MMENKGELKIGDSQIIIYQASDGTANLDVRLENEMVWLTQAQMVELFDRDRTVITKHINNIFKEGELDEKSNVHFLHIANSDKPVKIYNLDVIISLGYRVKSPRGTQFRVWANKVLKEYIIKGYAINNRMIAQQYNELKQTVKLLANVVQNKELSNEEATEFFEGVSEGIDQTLQCEILLSQELKDKGIKTGKFSINNSPEGGKNNLLTLYLIFDKDFKSLITVKACDKTGLEMGRAKLEIENQAGNAGYYDFTFDARTYIEVKSKIYLE